jgi:hypothetical protein
MLGHLWRSLGRQFAATILIFALVLQSVALAAAAGRLSDNAATDPNRAGFEVCATMVPQATIATRPSLKYY